MNQYTALIGPGSGNAGANADGSWSMSFYLFALQRGSGEIIKSRAHAFLNVSKEELYEYRKKFTEYSIMHFLGTESADRPGIHIAISEILEFNVIAPAFDDVTRSYQDKNLRDKVTSTVIGTLTQLERFEDWWEGEPVPVPFFDNKPLVFSFIHFEPVNDPTFLEDVDKALKSFLQLKKSDRINLSYYVYENLCEVRSMLSDHDISASLRKLQNEYSIWKYVIPGDILVQRDEDNRSIYIQLCCECAWEEEHGLQLIFKDGHKLTRVSQQDGHLTDYQKEEVELLPRPKPKKEKKIVDEKETSPEDKLSWWKRIWKK